MNHADMPTAVRDARGLNLVAEELKRARSVHGSMASLHEAYAVILEEVDELWDEVKKRRDARCQKAIATELIQIATMAVRAYSDLRLEDGRP